MRRRRADLALDDVGAVGEQDRNLDPGVSEIRDAQVEPEALERQQ